MRTHPATALLQPGMQLGKFELIRRLSIGGMAEIYLARAHGIEGFQKRVVLKRILPQYASNPKYVSMFLDEARLAATLDHPNIGQVYEAGSHDGYYFFTMEYVKGEDLRGILRTEYRAGRKVPLGCSLSIGIGVCAGLHYAHSRKGPDGRPLGIVHRDVSLSNVLVSYDGAVKVVDFGIAKFAEKSTETRAGTLKGKIAYMSPEQCRGEPLDRRSDVFAIGIVLYELTTATRLFKAETEFGILEKIISQDIEPPSRRRAGYPEELERIIMRALQRQPQDRYQSARALQRDLEAFARDQRISVSSIELGEYMQTLFAEKISMLAAEDSRSGVERDALIAASLGDEEDAYELGDVHLLDTDESPVQLDHPAAPVSLTGHTSWGVDAARRIGAPSIGLRQRPRWWVVTAAAGGLAALLLLLFITDRLLRWEDPSGASLAALPPEAQAPAEPARSGPKADSEKAANKAGASLASLAARVDTAPDLLDDESDLAAPETENDGPRLESIARDSSMAREEEERRSARSRNARPRRTRSHTRPRTVVARADASARLHTVTPTTPGPAPSPGAQAALASVIGDDEASAPGSAAAAPPAAPRHGGSVVTPAVALDPPGHAESDPLPPPLATPPAAREAPRVMVPPVPKPPPARLSPAALDAHASIENLSVIGPLSTSVVRHAIDRVAPGFRACYRSAARRVGRNDHGEVRVHFVIDEANRVRGIQIGHTKLPGLSSCLDTSVSRIRSRMTPDVGIVRVSFAVAYSPR